MDCSGHDCSDVMDKILLYIDGELPTDIAEKALLKELEKCSHCFEQYNIEHAFKEFLVSKAEHKKADPSLVAKIKAEIEKIKV